MRRVLLVVFAAAVTAQAQVHLVVKKDGSKVIYNVPSAATSKQMSDWSWLARQRNRSSKYDTLIDHYAEKHNVDPVLVRAVIQVESNFNPECVSTKGARGLMQLMPGTAKRFGVTKIHDPEQNIRGGVRYLALLLDLFRNDLPRVLAAYNAGENAVLRHGGIPPYSETTTYVARALTVYYGAPWGQATSFGGRRGKGTLKGGFGATVTAPIAMLPGMRYLGAR